MQSITFFRASLFFLFIVAGMAVIGSCKNPAAPREPGKFASQATFFRRLDSIEVNNATILLTAGTARRALSLPNGDLLFVGELEVPGTPRIAFAIRTNALGGIRWVKTYSISVETLEAIFSAGSEFVVVGSVFSGSNLTGGYAFWIDSLGNELRNRTFTDSSRSVRFQGAVAQPNGNVTFFGQSRRQIVFFLPNGFEDYYFINDGFIAISNPSGGLLSQRRFQSLGSRLNLQGSDIRFNAGVFSSGRIVLAGYYSPIYLFVKSNFTRIVAPDLYLLGLNSNGDSTAGFLYDDLYRAGDVLDQSVNFLGKLNTTDEALGIVQQPDGDLAVFARTNSTLYILVVNASLNGVVRRIIFPNIPSRFLNQMNVTRDGNFIFVGASTEKITREGLRSPAPGGRDVYIAKYSSEGNLIWEITQGSPFDDVGLTIQQTIDSGYIITGTSNNKPLLLKVDERGLLAE